MLRVIIILLLFVVVNTESHQIEDGPFINFTWFFDPIRKGENCTSIKGMKVAENNAMYEGRWLGIYVGFSEKMAKSVNCFSWDTFFDTKGYFHNFVFGVQNDTNRTLRDTGKPIDPKNGMYVFDYGELKHKNEMFNTYFYVDKDLYAIWETNCTPENNLLLGQMIIAFRRLEDVEKRQDTVNEIYKELEKLGQKTNKFRTKHENCKYPPLMKNPYKN